MVGIFKHKNAANALILLIYGLVLKFPLFLHPSAPLPDQSNNYLYHLIIRLLNPFAGSTPIIYSFISFLLFFTQATLLNRIANSIKLFPRPNYLVGMAFLLATSLMKEWSVFSAPLVVNSLMIWIWYSMVNLYGNTNPKTSIYNVAVLVSMLSLISSPAIVYIILLILALLVMRPLHVTEWMVAILGIVTPYYFLFVILFLTDQWDASRIVPFLRFHIPKFSMNLPVAGAISLLVVPFLMGGYFVNAHMNKMLIQVRKAWVLLLFQLLVSLLIILLNPGNSFLQWLLVVIPLAAFHGATYYYISSRWAGLILHWLTFLFAIAVSYGLLK